MSRSTFATRLFIGCLALCVASCGTPPGKGRKAEAGYRAATPVITALAKFHDERGHYPRNLNELVPTHLPDSRALLVRGNVEPIHSPHIDAPANRSGESNLDWFWYRPEIDSYSLMFQYTGPGVN